MSIVFTGTNKLKRKHVSRQPWLFAYGGKRAEIEIACNG